MKVLADFGTLLPAEARLVDWLQAGNRKVFVLSESVPDGPGDAVTLRATFIRYLALGGCEDCRLPETGLRVKGAFIDGDESNSGSNKGLDLQGATLPHDLALVSCHIPDPIILRSAKLKNLFLAGTKIIGGIEGDRMQADGSVSLIKTNIDGEVRLLQSRLAGNLDLSNSRVLAEAKALSCDGIKVGGAIFLKKSEFQGEVRLVGAKIEGNLTCDDMRLEALTYAFVCDRMVCGGSVFLRAASILGETRLSGASIKGNLSLRSTTLKSDNIALNCENAEILGTFFFADKTTVNGEITLTNAMLGAINDDPDCWSTKIRLNRCRYDAFLGNAPTNSKIRIEWLARIPCEEGEFWPDPYEHCAKVLREMGHGAEATKILIEKERLQRKARRERTGHDLAQARDDWANTPNQDGLRLHTDRVIGHWLHLTGLRLWDGILGAVVGYGRKPQNAAWWGLAMWLIGFLVFANAAGHGAIKPNLPQIQLNPAWVACADDRRGQLDCFLHHSDAASYPRFNAFIYSADTLIPVVSLEMQSYWIPDDRNTRGTLARGYLWFHIAMGWALTLLAVAGFSGLIKTDNTK